MSRSDGFLVDGMFYDAMTLRIDNSSITFDETKANGSEQAGLAVVGNGITDGVVKLCEPNSGVLGVLVSVSRNGSCVVKHSGIMEFPMADPLPNAYAGQGIVGADSAGATGSPGYVMFPSVLVVGDLAMATGAVLDVDSANDIATVLM